MKQIALCALFSAVVFTSCTMEKRHYRSGFYVNFDNNTRTEVVVVPQAQSESNTTFTEEEVFPKPVTTSLEQAPENPSTGKQVNADALKSGSLPVIVVPQNPTEDRIAAESSESSVSPENEKGSTATSDPDFPVWAYILIALILPPLAVALKYGIHLAFWLCLIFTLLGFIPGLVYALVYLALQGNKAEE